MTNGGQIERNIVDCLHSGHIQDRAIDKALQHSRKRRHRDFLRGKFVIREIERRTVSEINDNALSRAGAGEGLRCFAFEGVCERVERNLLSFFSKNLAAPANPTSPAVH